MAIKNGDTLRVHYTGTLSDGTVFDSSREREPLEFTMGKGMLIPGFEAAVMGHEAGENVTVTIPRLMAKAIPSWSSPWTAPRCPIISR